ncbi:MAG: response regulator [Rhodothermales bacterium]
MSGSTILKSNPISVLLAEDDPDDRMLTRRAFEVSELNSELRTVENGEDLIQYLRKEGKYAGVREAPRPGLILLDLNMPRLDGRDALRTIKSDSDLRRIPVVVFTTSDATHDITQCYDLGANAFVTKPVTFDGLQSAIQRLGAFWFEVANLPVEI